MNAPIEYTKEFIPDAGVIFNRLWNELAWVQRDQTPRLEYYSNDFNVPYTYGRGAGIRTYEPQPRHPLVTEIRAKLEAKTGTVFEVCFLNGYRDGSDQLGWHADDSPEMDDERPIAIVSFGARREIYFRSQNTCELCKLSFKKIDGIHVDAPTGYSGTRECTSEVTKLWLDSGSLCLMLPGMQDTHFHRIPKSSIVGCGPRISLTFRGYKTLQNDLQQ